LFSNFYEKITFELHFLHQKSIKIIVSHHYTEFLMHILQLVPYDPPLNRKPTARFASESKSTG